MDKTRKLRRYDRKDYSQVVEFPVEIVGRDGVVRRYSFEESVRLYQRRIASAPTRYADGDIADAEAEHCRQRIAQLRRSYFERYGGAALARLDEREDGRRGLAGEATAFLRRCLGDDAISEALTLQHLGAADHADAWAIQTTVEAPAFLLYLHPFTGESEDPARGAFFRQVKLLQQLRGRADGVESLVAFHHTADLGLVLTTSAAAARDLPGLPDPAEDADLSGPWAPVPESPAAAAQRQAARHLEEHAPERALHAFVRAYEADHFRRSAYVGAAVVADQLGHFEEASLAAEMGSRYFPHDAALAWHLAVARLRLGDLPGAREALGRAIACDAAPHSVAVLQALLDLHDGRMTAARGHLHAAACASDDQDPALRQVRRRLRLAVAVAGIARAIAVLTALIGGLALGVAPVHGALALGLGAVLFLLAPRALRRWAAAQVQRPGREGFALASVATLTAERRER